MNLFESIKNELNEADVSNTMNGNIDEVDNWSVGDFIADGKYTYAEKIKYIAEQIQEGAMGSYHGDESRSIPWADTLNEIANVLFKASNDIAEVESKSELTNSSNKPDGETMKEEMLRAFKMAYPEETISSKQFVESKQYMDVYCESGYVYRLEYNDGNVVTTCLNV